MKEGVNYHLWRDRNNRQMILLLNLHYHRRLLPNRACLNNWFRTKMQMSKRILWAPNNSYLKLIWFKKPRKKHLNKNRTDRIVSQMKLLHVRSCKHRFNQPKTLIELLIKIHTIKIQNCSLVTSTKGTWSNLTSWMIHMLWLSKNNTVHHLQYQA